LGAHLHDPVAVRGMEPSGRVEWGRNPGAGIRLGHGSERKLAGCRWRRRSALGARSPHRANTAHYFAYDGNVMGLVNATDGTWSARYEYGPFGEVVRATGPMAAVNPFRWSTKIQDEDSGLNHYGYRYYSAGVGRWLGRDPIGEMGGYNINTFIDNDGINFFDLDGLEKGALEKGVEGLALHTTINQVI
jgi:RHS repeat-associated protein